ncbi:YceI family protein [Nonomuraea sp. C10]|uniref:YceI family protein n=1 Tax=Nonomuraea sp. C10 TaxID=2600577 RepID=UPI0011CD6FCA|nr:YceI family protein [Nonomuraea sp. C10]TXK43251.1 YceI family protein [Nonomuraea sp. C10]
MGDSYTLGPETGQLLVETRRTGLGAKAGHDLTIEADRWRGEAVVDLDDPGASRVSVEVEAGSLRVVSGTGGVKPLTDSDRRDIARNIQDKVLHTGRFPAIAFRSRQVTGTRESFRVEGELTMAGQTRPLTLDCRFDGERVRGSATVTQSHWGVKPYSAFFGALKLDDDVEVRFDVELVSAAS